MAKESIPADEVETILAARVQEEVKRLLPGIVDAVAARGLSADGAMSMDGLAMAIAQLTDQGTGRKRIAPEVLVAREKAFNRMVECIQDAKEMPAYRLRGKIVFDERLIQPIWIEPGTHKHRTQEVEWPGVPNSMMEPLNDSAKAIFVHYQEWVGENVLPAVEGAKVTARGLVLLKQNTIPDEAPHVGRMQLTGGRGGDAAFIEKRVLGTVAAPAREQVA